MSELKITPDKAKEMNEQYKKDRILNTEKFKNEYIAKYIDKTIETSAKKGQNSASILDVVSLIVADTGINNFDTGPVYEEARLLLKNAGFNVNRNDITW